MSVILKQRENRTSWRLSGPSSSCLHRTASAFTVNKRGSGLFWHSLIEHSRLLFDNICCPRCLIYHWRRDAVDKLINQSINQINIPDIGSVSRSQRAETSLLYRQVCRFCRVSQKWDSRDLEYLIQLAREYCHLALVMFLHYLSLHKKNRKVVIFFLVVWVALKRAGCVTRSQ